MDKKVFWIQDSPAALMMMEKMLKAHGVGCYTHEKAQEFDYLIEQISPKIVVLDLETISANKEAFLSEWEKVKSIPEKVFGLYKDEELLVQDLALENLWKKPLAVQEITSEIKKLVNN